MSTSSTHVCKVLKIWSTNPKVIKHLSCSTQLSMKFHLLIESKILIDNNFFFCLKHSDVFILLTIVGILTFISMMNDEFHAQFR